MKKLYLLVLIIAMLALFKIGFDVYNLNAKQAELSEKIEKVEKINSLLNDQMAAVQRPEIKELKKITAEKQRELGEVIQPKDMIKQQLNLIDFALKQHQFYYAIEKLLELDHQIDSYILAPAIKNSLHQVITKDIESIKKFVQNNEAQQQKMNQLLFQLNNELKVEIQSPNLSISVDDKKYFWQKWFVVEKVNQPVEKLMQRSMVLKEAQLRMFIARGALVQGQYVQFHQEMNDIVNLLNQFPDETTRKLIKQIQVIDAMTLLATPTLSTRLLLG